MLGVKSSPSLPLCSLSHTYLLSFHYTASLPSFLGSLSLSLCFSRPLSEGAEWVLSTAQSHSAKGQKRPIPFFLGSACHSLISFNSLIRSFAGGSSGIGRRQYSLMLSLVQRILLSPWLSVKVPYLATSHRHD